MIDIEKANKIAKKIIKLEKVTEENGRSEVSSESILRSIKNILEEEIDAIEIN